MWVISGTKGNIVELISLNEGDSNGILPVGSYLTAEDKERKYVLRVEDSSQIETYSPSPMIVESGLEGLMADQKCQNKITATRILEYQQWKKVWLVSYGRK